MGAINFEDTLLDNSGAGVTGSIGLGIIIRRVSDDFLYDFNDATFKNVGWVTKSQVMVEVDAVELPGSYELSVTVTAWGDGECIAYFDYDGSDAGLIAYRIPLSFWVRGGVEAGAVPMRGTDGANITVPDIQGTASTFYWLTVAAIDLLQTDITAILGDVGNIDGAVMRGTDGALQAGTIVDGALTVKSTFVLLLALLTAKKVVRDGEVYTYYDQAGNILIIITHDPASGTATAVIS